MNREMYETKTLERLCQHKKNFIENPEGCVKVVKHIGEEHPYHHCLKCSGYDIKCPDYKVLRRYKGENK